MYPQQHLHLQRTLGKETYSRSWKHARSFSGVFISVLVKGPTCSWEFLPLQVPLGNLWGDLTWMHSRALRSHRTVSRGPFTWKRFPLPSWTLSQKRTRKTGQIFGRRLTGVLIHRYQTLTGLQTASLVTRAPRLDGNKGSRHTTSSGLLFKRHRIES